MTTATIAHAIAESFRPRRDCPRCTPGGDGLLCPTCEEVCHAESFRPLIDYALAHRCPRCKAPPGAYCHAPRKASADEPTHRLHARRQDRAIWHYYRDVGAAPWPERREPGRCYSTLPLAELAHGAEPDSAEISAEISVRSAAPPSPTADVSDPPAFWRQLI